MNVNDLITAGVNAFAAKLNLKPNEAAAVSKLVFGAIELAVAEAENRGGPALLQSLAVKHPQMAAVIESIPEVKALLLA